MRSDTRLSLALHAILHMADQGAPVTSSQLAERMHADASVIRRTLGGLRDAGYIGSDKGHGGGWRLTCDLGATTLFDIYEAVGRPGIFSLGLRENSKKCLVEKSVNEILDEAINDAEQVLLNRFRSVKLAQLADKFSRDFKHCK